MIEHIFEEIRAERQRQDKKFGEQNHPMLGRSMVSSDKEPTPSFFELKHNLEWVKKRCKTKKKGWFDILHKEICEAFSETEPEKQREKMVQAAAVAVAIIECLDRRIEK